MCVQNVTLSCFLKIQMTFTFLGKAALEDNNEVKRTIRIHYLAIAAPVGPTPRRTLLRFTKQNF